MMASLALRRPVNPFRGLLLASPVGRHRPVPVVPPRLIALGLAYGALWTAFSVVATLVAVR